MTDYSNLVNLGIVRVDPGAILGHPSPGVGRPLPYLPLNEPLQKPDFSRIPNLAISNDDTYLNAEKGGKNNKTAKSPKKPKEPRNFNWKKFLGITSIVLLAIFGLPKLIKKLPNLKNNIPNALNKAWEWLKKIPQAIKKIPNYFKKTP